ncbi:hypothetical protein B0T18DRAFT_439916 [Schizothecium vesticola]|uniref:Heterokaryon incompatibility domain-containing protein n=1 Tax=Schizothecium vesticola TaxID=314040 RepID=A0AA40BTF2_9PEZI|nr:hypothetical protein B0T18DRAFT_439916 [Schizothecium vesticola]
MDHLPIFHWMMEPYPQIPLVAQPQYDTLEYDGYQTRCGFDLTRIAALSKVGTVQNTIYKIYKSLSGTAESPVPYEITLSLGVLGCTIDHALHWMWNLGRGRHGTWDFDGLAAARMAAAGWCPRDVSVAREFLGELPMYCLSYMQRRTVPFDHWRCTVETCLLNQIDDSTYVTAHRTPGCQCQHVYPDQAEIRRILDAGGIPVVRLTRPPGANSGQGPISVEVKEGKLVGLNYYIAVSHVWSDGLGNSRSNSLPYSYQACEDGLEDMAYASERQRKIQVGLGKALKALAPVMKAVITPVRTYQNNPVSFWIDTLCIPLEKPYRNMAISRMKEAYAYAHMTIVLDSEFQTLEAKRCSDEEARLRLGLSGWMRRAWTFQEGALAGDMLRFLCHDGPFQLPAVKRGGSPYVPVNVPQSQIDDMVKARQGFSLRRCVLEDSKKFFAGMKTTWLKLGPLSPPGHRVARLVGVWERMRLRATSHELDKFICFAVACTFGNTDRVRLKPLLDLPHEQRMREWVRTQEIIPSGLLFIPGERYAEPGFRWVPKAVYPVPLSDDGYAMGSQAGGPHVFKKPGFVFNMDPPCRPDRGFMFFISDLETGLRYSVSLLEQPPSGFLQLLLGPVAIILKEMVNQNPIEEELVKELGALVGNVRNLEEQTYGDFVCRVEVGLFVDYEGSGVVPIPASYVTVDQRWIVG